MMDLNEKLMKWTEKVKAGNKDYFMITRANDDLWYFLSGTHAEQILSMKVLFNEGHGFRPEYEYSVKKTETDKMAFSAVVKDDIKMIIQDGNGMYSFGIKDSASPARAVLIYCRTEHVHTFLFGSNPNCKVSTIFANAFEVEDAIDQCMDEIYSELEKSKSMPPETEEQND